MKIKKVINNNIVVVNQDGQDVIVMGRGLGFKKRPGAEIDQSSVEKEFVPKKDTNIDQLGSLLTNISIEDVQAATKILNFAENKLNSKLNTTELISLSDHIHNSLERNKQGIELKNNLLWDIKRFYPIEFQIGQKGIEIIKELTGITLEEDEAGFLALHIVDAENEHDSHNANEITKFIQNIMQILKFSCHQEIDENSAYYYRFATHLKYLAQRVFDYKDLAEQKTDDVMLKLVSTQYPEAFSYSKKVKDFIDQTYHCNLSDDELMYLTLHIQKMLQRKAKE